MCGIAGFIDLRGQPVKTDLIVRMLAWLHHRGPDERGIWCNKQIGIGTARLSIIDLVTGKQPIANEDETVWVAFNGEIYNFVELRTELEKEGHRFRTRTDTEVIVHAYEEWGKNFVHQIKGMFGIALVDMNKRSLILARDVTGEKPLFYTIQPGFFAFASETKPLLHELPISRETEPLAVHSFFAFSRPVNDLCVFRAIRKLRPGHLLELDLVTGELDLYEYWRPTGKKTPLTLGEAKIKLVSLLEETIQRFLIADVPIGAFLSGGADSSAVVAMTRKFFDHPVMTFTAVYDDPYISEAREANKVATLLGTEHHEILIRPEDVVRLLPKLIWHLEEPFADASFIPAYFVSEKASEFVKVALTGDGGDELFGGYDWYLGWRLLKLYQRFPQLLRDVIKLGVDRLPSRFFTSRPLLYHYINGAKRVVSAAGKPEDISAFLALTGDVNLTELLPENALKELVILRSEVLDGYDPESSLDKILFFQYRSLLPELFFTKVDRMSMANSLECRSPLVYQDIVEFALQLPTALKIHITERKYLLKRAFEEFLPREILYRPKKGFSIPFYRWLRDDTVLRSLVEHYALGPTGELLAEYAGVNYSVVNQETRDYLEQKHNRWVLPWKMVCFGLWWDTFVQRDGKKPLETISVISHPSRMETIR